MVAEAVKKVIAIASPLEAEHVARISAFDPEHFDVIHVPDLHGAPRYVADHAGAAMTRTAAQSERWSEILGRAEILFDFDRSDPEGLPKNAPNLRWVQATSSGIGEFMRRTGLDRTDIAFTTARGVHARPLAEFTLLGLLYFFRDVPFLNARKADKHWERYTVRGLQGARVLVVGLGSLGQAVALDCHHMGVEVWGTRRTPGGDMPPGVSRVVAQEDIRDVMGEVDALVLACPLTDQTRGLIDRAAVEALKPGAVIVNIARGQVIDETAMIEGLRSGRIKGAALDVFEVEPLPKDNPLWELPNVLISPHSASTVHAENERIVDIFLDNLGRYRDGAPLRNLYDRVAGY